MTSTRFFVAGKEVPLTNGLPISTSFLIADIRDPSKRNSDYTKTIEIPSTLEIDKIFEFAFEVNSSYQNFNPNLDTPVIYMINNTVVLTGSMQLTDIELNRGTGEVTYICNIKGQLTDLFYTIGEYFLTGNEGGTGDLDFSEYDHALIDSNVYKTWNPDFFPNTNVVNGVDTALVAGIGYRYPLIDYGLNGGNLQDYYVHHQRPLLFAYEYMKKIFQRAGKTWTSTFLELPFFKSMAVPCTEEVAATKLEKETKQVYAEISIPDVHNYTMNYIPPGPSGGWQRAGANHVAVYDDTSTTPYYDASNQYNTTSGILAAGFTRLYNLNVTFHSRIEIKYPTAFYVDGFTVDYYIFVEEFISGSWVTTTMAVGPLTINVTPGASFIETQLSVAGSPSLVVGDFLRVHVSCNVRQLILRVSPGGALITTGAASFDFSGNANDLANNKRSEFKLSLQSPVIYEGDTLQVNKAIPQKVKQKDFLTSIIKAFNLMILPDKDNPNNFFIEPWNDFYSGTFVDWTGKLDTTSPTKIRPVSEVDSKRFIYKYKTDGDYYNKSYQDAWQEPYGQKTFEAENVFVTGEQSNELIFSPTPLVGNDLNGLIIPKIYKSDGGNVSFQKSNIRLLQWSGFIPLSYGFWRSYTVNGAFVDFPYYPYAGHLDNPYSPSFDLCFDQPAQLYYESGAAPLIYTADNLFSVYHRPYVLFITDKNSKMVIEKFYLDEIDIRAFDFRNQVFSDGAYYLVNAIKDFNLLESKTTTVELLKLLR